MHDFIVLIDRNALGFLIVTLALIAAMYGVVVNFINRNKPTCKCECCEDPEEDDEEEEEVVALGGEEEDDEPR